MRTHPSLIIALSGGTACHCRNLSGDADQGCSYDLYTHLSAGGSRTHGYIVTPCNTQYLYTTAAMCGLATENGFNVIGIQKRVSMEGI